MDEKNTTCSFDGERLAVIENIRAALADGDKFRKVEIGDPKITDEDVKRVIIPFDTERRKLGNKVKAFIARKIAERETKRRNTETEIIGIENAKGIKGGALITSNHFSYMDNTVIRLLAMKCKKKRKFHIVVQETNIFMEGYFGFLMKNCNTLPVSRSASYMRNNLTPAIEKFLSRGDLVLIYPEQEMWFNYKKPREYREGAYHFAVKNNVPIISCFVEMRNMDEAGEGGFRKVKHILHVLPPIYPDITLPERERRARMMEADRRQKRECYERVYGIPLTDDFDPVRDIAGYAGE